MSIINVFQVAVSPQYKPCAVCNDPICPSDFLVTQLGSPPQHLDCFQPQYPIRISMYDVTLEGEAEQFRTKVEEWVELWNNSFCEQDFFLPLVYFADRVFEYSPRIQRELVEPLKFLTAEEVEGSISLVCKSWHIASRMKELWIDFYTRKYPGPIDRSGIHADFRSLYIRRFFRRCERCERLLENPEIHFMYPTSGKVICSLCWIIADEAILFTRSLGFSEDVLLALKLPVFQLNSQKCTFQSTLQSCLWVIREKGLFIAKKLRHVRLISRTDFIALKKASMNFSLKAFEENIKLAIILPFLMDYLNDDWEDLGWLEALKKELVNLRGGKYQCNK